MSSPHRPSPRHAAGLLLIMAVAAGCTSGKPTPPPPPATATTTPHPTIQAGTLGQLPPPARQSGPRLTLPHPSKGLLQVPGSYPFGSQVRFQVPIRNDGDQSIRIDRLDAG